MPRFTRLILCPLAASLGGCGLLSAPKLPTPISTPEVRIQSVHLMESSAEGSRYRIDLLLNNPNDEPLPLTFAWYALSIGGSQARYEGDNLPNATLPAGSQVKFSLPAVVAASGAVGQSFDVSGSIQMHPGGQIKNVFYELGMPLPRAGFQSSGSIQPPPPQPVKKGGRVDDSPVGPKPADNKPAPPPEPRTLPPAPM